MEASLEALELEMKEKTVSIRIELAKYIPFIAQFSDPYIYHRPERGLYLPNQIVPFLRANQTAYGRSSFGQKKFEIAIKNVRDMNEDLLSDTGQVIFTRAEFLMNRRWIRCVPSIDAQAYKAAIAVVLEYLIQCCPFVRLLKGDFDLYKLIRKKYHPLIHTGAFSNELRLLTNDVDQFINGDYNHLYSYTVHNRELVISKHIDGRIYQWYMDRVGCPF